MKNPDAIHRPKSVGDGAGFKVEKQVVIGVPPHEVFNFWRRLENLPQFMTHIESVTQHDELHSHWKVKGPAGKTVEWEAEIIEEREPEMISWRSLPGGDVDNAGSVWFKPSGNNSTLVKVSLKYDPPGGKAGAALAKLFGRDAESEIEKDLARLKDMLESRPVHS